MTRAICIGECMVELRPVGEGLFRRAFAGDAYNTAVYLKREAPELDVQFATVTGVDPLSQAMREVWRKEGVGDALAAFDPDRRPGLYMIETDARGERSFHYWRGESAARGWARALCDEARDGRLGGAALVYVSGISLAVLPPGDRELAFDLLRGLRGDGAWLAFDPNLRPALWGDLEAARIAFERVLALADILLPSRQDLELLYGEPEAERLAGRLIDLGAREFAITAEAGPCLVFDGAIARLPPPPVAQVVDTSGAGDSFNGAYLAARLKGRSPAEAAGAGLRLAARVVTLPGAIADGFSA
jgi:2-dehydro-3-deoxygluconokinase